MTNQQHILLATLGGQPQVVTFTLDLLLAKGFPISDVIVLHPRPSQPRLQHSLACLTHEFIGPYRETGNVIHFHSHPLKLNGEPITDITDDFHADGTLDTIHQLIGKLKRDGNHIHLSVTGGRRMIALLAISVAALNFDRHDHIWHIYTPEEVVEQVKDGKMMHVPPEAGVKLIQGPFISLGAYIHQDTSFRTARTYQIAQMEAQERQRCEQVWQQATPAQRRVLQAFSTKSLRRHQVAEELGISINTVNSHIQHLLDYCRAAWNLPLNETIDYHFFFAHFADYFQHSE